MFFGRLRAFSGLPRGRGLGVDVPAAHGQAPAPEEAEKGPGAAKGDVLKTEKPHKHKLAREFAKSSGPTLWNFWASPGPGVAKNGFSAKNAAQKWGRNSNPCPGDSFRGHFSFWIRN